jgi:ribosomal protein S12
MLTVAAGCIVAALQDEVLIAGFGRRGHAVGDIPGVRFKVGWLAAAAAAGIGWRSIGVQTGMGVSYSRLHGSHGAS